MIMESPLLNGSLKYELSGFWNLFSELAAKYRVIIVIQ